MQHSADHKLQILVSDWILRPGVPVTLQTAGAFPGDVLWEIPSRPGGVELQVVTEGKQLRLSSLSPVQTCVSFLVRASDLRNPELKAAISLELRPPDPGGKPPRTALEAVLSTLAEGADTLEGCPSLRRMDALAQLAAPRSPKLPEEVRSFLGETLLRFDQPLGPRNPVSLGARDLSGKSPEGSEWPSQALRNPENPSGGESVALALCDELRMEDLGSAEVQEESESSVETRKLPEEICIMIAKALDRLGEAIESRGHHVASVQPSMLGVKPQENDPLMRQRESAPSERARDQRKSRSRALLPLAALGSVAIVTHGFQWNPLTSSWGGFTMGHVARSSREWTESWVSIRDQAERQCPLPLRFLGLPMAKLGSAFRNFQSSKEMPQALEPIKARKAHPLSA